MCAEVVSALLGDVRDLFYLVDGSNLRPRLRPHASLAALPDVRLRALGNSECGGVGPQYRAEQGDRVRPEFARKVSGTHLAFCSELSIAGGLSLSRCWSHPLQSNWMQADSSQHCEGLKCFGPVGLTLI